MNTVCIRKTIKLSLCTDWSWFWRRKINLGAWWEDAPCSLQSTWRTRRMLLLSDLRIEYLNFEFALHFSQPAETNLKTVVFPRTSDTPITSINYNQTWIARSIRVRLFLFCIVLRAVSLASIASDPFVLVINFQQIIVAINEQVGVNVNVKHVIRWRRQQPDKRISHITQ